LQSDKAKKAGANFKNLRRILKFWQSQLSNLKVTVQNNKMMLLLLDLMEEHRDISLEEWNPRNIIHSHLENLLEQERV
jgi:hypothetical protein